MSAPVAQALPVGSPSALPSHMSAGAPRFLIQARYSKRMRLQKVYPLVVKLVPAEKKPVIGSAGDPVMIRPFVPGAHVIPLEQELGPTNSRGVTFYVTPLARGKLKNAHLGVYSRATRLQEIPTPMKGYRTRGTWVLALLTLLVPFLIWHLTSFYDLSSTGPNNQGPVAAAFEKIIPPLTGDAAWVSETAAQIQSGYDQFKTAVDDNYLIAYSAAALLVLTLLWWLTHRPTGGRKSSKPMLLPLPATGAAGVR